MTDLASDPRPLQDTPALSAYERTRYARHLVLPQVGEEGQRRLKAASVLIVGTGGLGSPVALYLAAAGVGHIGLVDYDAVDITNLQRQILHSERTLGIPKVDSAARRLRDLNHSTRITTYPLPLTSDNALEIIAGYDVIVDGTDNFPTRFLLNDAAVMLGKPLVYGSIYRFEGQVSIFGTSNGPCYRCLIPQPPPPHLVPSCAEAGVLGVLPGTVGTLQATETLKLLLQIGEPLIGRLLIYDALELSFDVISLPKRPTCPVCGPEPTITRLIDYEEYCGMPAWSRSNYALRPHPQTAETEMINLSVEQVKSRMDAGEPLLLLDIRETPELTLCRLAGARHIRMGEIAVRQHEIPRDRPVIVFCHSGIRSAAVTEYLRGQGFENVYNMLGGIDAWSRRIDPSIPRY